MKAWPIQNRWSFYHSRDSMTLIRDRTSAAKHWVRLETQDLQVVRIHLERTSSSYVPARQVEEPGHSEIPEFEHSACRSWRFVPRNQGRSSLCRLELSPRMSFVRPSKKRLATRVHCDGSVLRVTQIPVSLRRPSLRKRIVRSIPCVTADRTYESDIEHIPRSDRERRFPKCSLDPRPHLIAMVHCHRLADCSVRSRSRSGRRPMHSEADSRQVA